MFDSIEIRNKENKYLESNVFYGLTNLNDGFDAPSIKYFSEEEFEIILNRVKNLKLGINGMEAWKEGEFYSVTIFEDKTQDPTDFNWYIKAFNELKKDQNDFQYCATYYIPNELLN